MKPRLVLLGLGNDMLLRDVEPGTLIREREHDKLFLRTSDHGICNVVDLATYKPRNLDPDTVVRVTARLEVLP